jgi:hypothetical protein
MTERGGEHKEHFTRTAWFNYTFAVFLTAFFLTAAYCVGLALKAYRESPQYQAPDDGASAMILVMVVAFFVIASAGPRGPR